MKILPFSIQGERLALDLDQVQGVEMAVPISFVPGSPSPVAGILLHRGGLIPVWNTCALAGRPIEALGRCPQYIAALVDGKALALPVDGVEPPVGYEDTSPASSAPGEWRPQPFHGLKIYRPAGRPLSYRPDTPPSAFKAEDIWPKK